MSASQQRRAGAPVNPTPRSSSSGMTLEEKIATTGELADRGPPAKVGKPLPPYEYEMLTAEPVEKPPVPHHMKFIPTEFQRKLVLDLALWGVPRQNIAAHVINPNTGHGVAVNTLVDNFSEELDRGTSQAYACIARSLYLQAVGVPAEYDDNGNQIRAERAPVPAAGIWLSKVRMGWTEHKKDDDKGGGGDQNDPQLSKELEQLTADEIRQIRDIARKRLDQQSRSGPTISGQASRRAKS